MAGDRTALPAAKVTGSTLGASTSVAFSSLFPPLENSRPMALKGAVTTLARTFLMAVQMASPRESFGSLMGR